MGERFELRASGPYSLAASARFLEGFTPAAYEAAEDGHLHMAFVVDGGEAAVGVCVWEEAGVVVGEVFGEADLGVVRRQVERILSLDVDGRGFPGVGKRDAVVGGLRARYPGLRPVCFYSPYEAAAWALIGQRVPIVRAAGIKASMARDLGQAVGIHGGTEYAFPGPSRLARLEGFSGLFGRKVGYLRRLGLEAAAGKLDAAYLRSLPAEEALAGLRELPGIGSFSAELILLRGAGEPDLLPLNEPRLGRAVALAYGLKGPPTAQELREISWRWRPYRTWVGLHLRAMLEEETGEIAGARGVSRSSRPSRT